MNYEEFFLLAYNEYISLSLISISLMLLFLISLRKFVVSGVLDPFHFIYSFVFSTSYSVIIVLWVNDAIDLFYLVLLITYGVFFLSPIYYFANARKDNVSYFMFCFFKTMHKGNFTNRIFVIAYFVLLMIIIKIKGFSIFTSTNRFEDNAGIGILARFYDVIWLYVAGIYIISYKEKITNANFFKRIIISIPFFSFFILNLFIIGSKSELIQYILFYYLVLSVYGIKQNVSFLKLSIFIFLSLSFALIVLYFNFKLQGNDDVGILLSETFFRLTDRIMSNGDMYYLGLPNEVIEKIKMNNFFVDLFAPILSSKFLSYLSGYDIYNYDIGKQLLLYHYPMYNLAGGPVEHFDLFGYKHFGVAGGAFFSLFVGMIVVTARNIVCYAKNNKNMSVVASSFYFKMLFIILKPGVFLGFLFDFMFVYLCFYVLSLALLKKRNY